MVYRYVPKTKKRLNLFSNLRNIEIPKKNVHVVAAILAALCILIVIGGNITSYTVRISELEAKLNETMKKVSACNIALLECSDNLSVCEKTLKEREIALSGCENLRIRYKTEIDTLKTNYTRLETKYNDLLEEYDKCSDKYRKLKDRYDVLKDKYDSTLEHYRNYVCCVAKIGKDVKKMYWSLEGNEIICSVNAFEGSQEIDVSELGC